MAAFIGADP